MIKLCVSFVLLASTLDGAWAALLHAPNTTSEASLLNSTVLKLQLPPPDGANFTAGNLNLATQNLTMQPDPWHWFSGSLMYDFSQYESPRMRRQDFATLMLACQLEMVHIMQERQSRPYQPLPDNHFECGGGPIEDIFEIEMVEQDAWQLTYLTLAKVLMEMWGAMLEFGSYIPRFLFTIEMQVQGRWVKVAQGLLTKDFEESNGLNATKVANVSGIVDASSVTSATGFRAQRSFPTGGLGTL